MPPLHPPRPAPRDTIPLIAPPPPAPLGAGSRSPLPPPPRLAPGDPTRLIAPAGPVPPDEVEAGARLLRKRYRVRYDPTDLFRKEGFLAGPDEHRLAELRAAI